MSKARTVPIFNTYIVVAPRAMMPLTQKTLIKHVKMARCLMQIPDKCSVPSFNQVATSLVLPYIEILELSLPECKLLCICPESSTAPGAQE